jgi:hypothetical protein
MMSGWSQVFQQLWQLVLKLPLYKDESVGVHRRQVLEQVSSDSLLLRIENSAGVVADAISQRHGRDIEVVAHFTTVLLTLCCESGALDRGISAELAEILGVAIIAPNQANERDGYGGHQREQHLDSNGKERGMLVFGMQR